MLNAAATSASIRCTTSRTISRWPSPARRPRPRPRRAAPVPTRALGHPACFHITILVIQPCRFRLWSTAERCFRLFPLSSPVAGAWTGRDLLRFSRLLQGSGSAMPVASLRLWGRRRARCRLCPRRQGRSACRVVAPQQRPVGVFLGRSWVCDARSVGAHSPVLRHRRPICLFYLSPRPLVSAARTPAVEALRERCVFTSPFALSPVHPRAPC